MEVLVIGDSHAVALEAGVAEMRQTGISIGADVRIAKLFSFPQTLRPFHRVGEAGVEFTHRAASSRLAAATGRRSMRPEHGVAWAFVLGTTTTHFVRSATWRRYAPVGIAQRHNRLPLSTGALLALCRDYTAPSLRFYGDIVDHGIKPLCVLAPPPRADDRALTRGQPVELFLEVDRLLRDYVTGRLHDIGVLCISPPKAAYGASGNTRMLREALADTKKSDFHHANGQYGALMIPCIISAARAVTGREVQLALKS